MLRGMLVVVGACFLALAVEARDAILCVPPPMPDGSGDVDALVMCINKANALGGGTIELGGRTYTLPSATFGTFTVDGPNGLPDITSNIVIKNGTLTKDPSLAFRHLHISGPGSLSLKKVALENGNDESGNGGGSIFVASTGILGTVENSSFNNNLAESGTSSPTYGGGAIRVNGEFFAIEKTIFSNNQTVDNNGASGADGGAIYMAPSSVGGIISQSIFVANMALSTEGESLGGAIVVDTSSLINAIVGSSFIANNAQISGGAIFLNAGGGINTIDRTSFSFNTGESGGAISFNDGSTLGTLSNSTFDNNTAFPRVGGAIVLAGNIGTLTNCTFNQNSGSEGGALSLYGIINQLFNNTIVGNQAQTANGGAGIYLCGTINDMISNIVADNLDTDTTPGTEDDISFNGVGDCGSTPTIDAALFNLIGSNLNSPSFVNNVDGNIVGSPANPINPNVGVLKDNGGPTETMALLPNSPAIGAGANPLGQPHDQRGAGFRRRVHGLTDMGAFEVQEPPVCPCPPGRHCRPEDCPLP